jgi:glucokinase
MDLLRFLLTRYERVSYERIVSGPGLVNLYDFFRGRTNQAEPEWLAREKERGDPSAAISKAGMERTDIACLQALEMFVSLYGAEAGNLALKLLATGGVFVGGGIAPKILPRIQEGEFLPSFHHKGRYRSLMKQIPVEVVLNDRTALIGAAHYALLMEEMERGTT